MVKYLEPSDVPLFVPERVLGPFYGGLKIHTFLHEVYGSLMYLPKDRVLGPAIASGDYLKGYECSPLMNDFLKEGDTVVDAGACIGSHTLMAARKVGPKGRVIAIEPHPWNLLTLAENLKMNKITNVEIYPYAIGEKSQYKVPMWQDWSNFGDHRMWDPGNRAGMRLHVNQFTLDDIVGDRKVNLVKIDIQGCEVKCFRGAKSLLGRSVPMVMAAEYELNLIKGAGDSGEEFVDTLTDSGFTIFGIGKNQELVPATRPELLEPVGKRAAHFSDLWCTKGF